MTQRHIRQRSLIGDAGQASLAQKKVLILGCGGLGGYLLEHAVRLGVGHITVADGDVFDISNLNRQLLSTPENLGKSKAQAAAARAALIDPAVHVRWVADFFSEDNAAELIRGQDLVLDGLDNIPARLLMERICTEWKVPIVHGAVTGWHAQVSTVLPGSGTLQKLYGSAAGKSACADSLPFGPAYCASVQSAEALKLLLGEPPSLSGKLLLTDLKTMNQRIISF